MTTSISVQPNGSALPALDRAKAALDEARSVGEVLKIRAVAQAVASVERSREIGIDAGEILILTEARLGELTSQLDRAPGPHSGKAGPGRGKKLVPEQHKFSEPMGSAFPTTNEGAQKLVPEQHKFSKGAALADAGISRQQASRAERVAKAKRDGTLDRIIAAERAAGRIPTLSTVLAIAGIEDVTSRDGAIAKLEQGDEPHAVIAGARRSERVEAIKTHEAPALGSLGRFPVLLADPPWRYDEGSATPDRKIENQYPTMSLEEICALPVRDAAAPDCVLFLWATSPKLGEAFRVLEAWGFNYRTCLVWVKDKLGMGFYVRQKHELLLIATRGAPPTPKPADRQSSVVVAPRPKEHSKKPDVFHELVERMYPEFAKLELFARRAREGWSAWGNQAVDAAS